MTSQGFVAALTNVLVVAMVATGSAEDRRTVSVSGHGETQVEPDIARVEMGIFVFGADLLKAKQEADAKIASLLEAFKLLAVKPEDVQTTQVYVKPKSGRSKTSGSSSGTSHTVRDRHTSCHGETERSPRQSHRSGGQSPRRR